MRISFFQVDAFTSTVFGGNPAAVCLLNSWLDDQILQNIAAENNLSETAFIVRKSKALYELRWFTPTIEVDLCGHATLAAAFAVFSFVDSNLREIEFKTASGKLTVTKEDGLLSMDFPARKPIEAEIPPTLIRALGKKPVSVLKSRDLLVVFEDEADILEIAPDFELLKQIDEALGIIITAPGKKSDFVSRFFAPKAGIPEDPVTGSAHSTLIPYWAERLNKERLYALQLSKRGGELFCENKGNRVKISGNAVLYAKGEIFV
ncbi:MAG: PhzF family phenazine biosynthesis protein [Calditrichaeota bacterium]|nr:PhzF family phenazine biosynthesis protein [Calditrichota bacterium]